MFITATPNSELRRKLQAEISKTDIKIKVIEKSGKKVVRHLQRNNPFKEDIWNPCVSEFSTIDEGYLKNRYLITLSS